MGDNVIRSSRERCSIARWVAAGCRFGSLQGVPTMDDTKRIEGHFSNPRAQGGGVIQTWIDGGLDTAQAVLNGSIEVLDQSRLQLTERVAQTLDWAEGFPKGMFTVARQLNRGVD